MFDFITSLFVLTMFYVGLYQATLWSCDQLYRLGERHRARQARLATECEAEYRNACPQGIPPWAPLQGDQK